MSIFNFWQNTKSAETQSEAAIRQSARQLVESGEITLTEARNAADGRQTFAEQSQQKQTWIKDSFKHLANRAKVNRNGFSYDKHGLCQADAIFVDELCNLVAQFDTPALPPMGAAALKVEIDRLAAEMNSRMDELEALEPAKPKTPKPAEVEAQKLAEITQQAESDFRANKNNCQSKWNSLAAFAAARRFAFKNPEMEFRP